MEMYEDGGTEVCGPPLDFVTVVLRPGAQSCSGGCHGPLMVLAIILLSCRCMIGWLLSGGSAMKCEPPPFFFNFLFIYVFFIFAHALY